MNQLRPIVVIASALLLAVAVVLFIIGQPAPAGMCLAAGVALLVPSTVPPT